MRVILRPIYKNSWVNVKRYRNCYEDLAPYWTRGGRIYTGLTDKDRERLEEKLGGIDLRPESEFWANFYIRTTGKDLYLFTDDPMDELRYLFLKNHKLVQRSLTERKPGARFALINEEEEARKRNVHAKLVREAMKEFDKLSPEDMRKVLRLYGHNADKMNNEVVENRLFDIVQGDPRSFVERWVRNEHRDTEAFISRAISKNIVRKNKNIYKYGTEVIGHSLDDVVAFFEDKKNQDVKMVIMDAIEGKDVIIPKARKEEANLPLPSREKDDITTKKLSKAKKKDIMEGKPGVIDEKEGTI